MRYGLSLAALSIIVVPFAGAAAAAVPAAASGVRFAFEANRGQTAAEVGFLARAGGATVFVTERSCVLALGAGEDTSGAALRLTLAGARKSHLEGEGLLTGSVSDFHGSDPTRWRTGIPSYAAVRAHGILPGVDAVYYGQDGRLEYDFVVSPGVDPASINLRVEGADSLALTPSGDLLMSVAGRTVVQRAPRFYQDVSSGRSEVAGGFVLRGSSEVGFETCGADPALPLVIDPVVAWSTYLGGSGGDLGLSIAVDATGNAYVAGNTSSANFPTTAGVLDQTLNGTDIFVSKIAPDGATLVWSTFLGGNATDGAWGVAIDAAGNILVAGDSGSTDFPTTENGYQRTLAGGGDVVIAKLSPAADALLYGSYLGGTSGDRPTGRGLALDAAGFAYVSGRTYSQNFPTTWNAYQQSWPGGNVTRFLAKFDTSAQTGLASLVYSTVISNDGGADGSLAVDSGGRAYIAGYTASAVFPTTAGAFDRTFNGQHDAYVCKIDTNVSGTAGLIYSTYLGGKNGDSLYDIAVNSAGEAFAVGLSTSSNYPTTANAYSRTLRKANATDTVLTRLNAAGSALLYSTYFGGKGLNELASAVAIDATTGHPVVGGYTNSTDFPVTAGALQPTFHGDPRTSPFEGFLAEFDTAASGSASLVYSSYLGGTLRDLVKRIAIGPAGSWLVTGQTSSTDFLVTSGALQTTFGGGNDDAFVYRQDR